jgi:hypothetical protein
VVGHLLDNRKNITSSPNEPKCVLNIQQMAKGKAQNVFQIFNKWQKEKPKIWSQLHSSHAHALFPCFNIGSP